MKPIKIVTLGLVLLLLIAGCSTKPDAVWSAAELLELGEQYLLDMEYEQALAQFLRVVEIEPAEPRAYLGAAQAHLGLGDLEAAVDILERGLAATGDGDIAALLTELSRQWERQELLEELHALFEADRVEDALALVNNTPEFQALCQGVTEAEPQIYRPGSGRGVGIYRARESRFGSYYVYYGDYADRVREGQGLWCVVNADEYYLFEGRWEGDAPNGYGEVMEWYGGLSDGMRYRHKLGELSGGLWDGNMLWNFVYPDATESFPVHFRMGLCTLLEPDEKADEEDEPDYIMSKTGTTVEEPDGNAMMTSRTDITNVLFGVAGFDDYER